MILNFEEEIEMLLFLIRHGDPTYHPDELTPLGRRQAEAVGRRLARYGLDEIYSSSSQRAIETSIPTCELLKKDATILDWTNESHAWEQENIPDADGRRTWCFALQWVKDTFTSKEMRELGYHWYEHPFFLQYPSVKEGYFRIQKETRDFLAAQGFEFDEERGEYRNLLKNEKRVALFAHHGFGTNFLASVLDIPWPQVCTKMNFCHSGMTVFYFDPNKEYVVPQMLTLANDGHLLADNLPTCYNNMRFF